LLFIVNTKEYIYVALDFEGLRSLERTPQEGNFIIVFNIIINIKILNIIIVLNI